MNNPDLTDVTIPFDRPFCDLCIALGRKNVKPAMFDGATFHGPWAYMCDEHMAKFGVGLGMGRGQRLHTEDEK